ncbi:MAG TPA: DUF3568 family protein [Victivallales bacterium]|nr:DUF3568 family protein [Victivallales bacterium]
MGKNKLVKLFFINGLLASTLLFNGCLIALGVVGTVWYLSSLHGTLYYPVNKVEPATKEAMGELHIASYSSKFSGTGEECKITGKTTTGDEVNITLTIKGVNETGISIKIGRFGDKELSKLLLKAIKKKLEKT